MSRKHDAALVALVATSGVGTKFFPGYVPKDTNGKPIPAPYAVYWPMAGIDTVTRLTGPASTKHPRWTIHCVGSTIEQAQWVFEQIESVLKPGGRGVIPAVAGENPGRFWFESPIPIQRDDDSTPSLFDATAECGFTSERL